MFFIPSLKINITSSLLSSLCFINLCSVPRLNLILRLAIIILILLFVPCGLIACPKIFVSNIFYHSIATNIKKPDCEINFISAQQDIRTASLTNKDIKNLQLADLIIITDKNFEPYAQHIIKNFPKSKIQEITQLNNIHILKKGKYIDYHLWLNIKNMIILAEFLKDYYIQADPEAKKIYIENLVQFKAKMQNLADIIKEKMIVINQHNYYITHNYLGYFIEEFGLKNIKDLNLDHGHHISLKDIKLILDQVNKDSCLILEPFMGKSFQNIDAKLKFTEINIENFEKNIEYKDLYYYILNNISYKLNQCF